MKIIFWMSICLLSQQSWAGDNDYGYRNQSEYKSSDYLYQTQGFRKDPVFDEYRSVDLGLNLGVGSPPVSG